MSQRKFGPGLPRGGGTAKTLAAAKCSLHPEMLMNPGGLGKNVMV